MKKKEAARAFADVAFLTYSADANKALLEANRPRVPMYVGDVLSAVRGTLAWADAMLCGELHEEGTEERMGKLLEYVADSLALDRLPYGKGGGK